MPGIGRGELLVVDDDTQTLDALKSLFASDGYRVRCAAGGREALRVLAHFRPDCVVLDYAMPDISGLETLRRLREAGDEIPVVVLSAKSDSYDRIAGYGAGADVYVGKEEDPGVLRAAVRRVIGRRDAHPGRIEVGSLSLDPGAWMCSVDGVPVRLPPRLFHLLYALASQPGRVLRKEQLLHQVWGVNSDVYRRVVDNSVGELRRLLGDESASPRFIHTVRGVGYKLEADG
ncbi:MAG: response regulator transcription factor [Candidatus Dormibacteria bacterium]